MSTFAIRQGFAAAFVLAALSAGCVSTEVRVVDMTPPDQLQRMQTEDELLDIGLAIFDPNVPEDYDERIRRLIQPDIREAEAIYFPYFAKNMLQSTGNWGAVRVVPRPTNAVDLMVSGKILHSDGESMEIEVRAVDARGTEWLHKSYEALASKYAYDDSVPSGVDPFQAIYKDLANDLLSYRATLSNDEIREIRRIAEMRFAKGFAPDAFDDYLARDGDDGYDLVKLPAENDPNLERVRKIREREYLFIDTVDEYYANYHRNMFTPYQNWRKSTYDEAIEYKQLRAQARARALGGTMAIVGGVAAIYESNDYAVDASGVVSVMSGAVTVKSAIAKRAEASMHADAIEEIGTAAEAEILPYTLELENQTLRLQGSVEEQYDQLRGILRRAYYEDLGLPVPDEPESTGALGADVLHGSSAGATTPAQSEELPVDDGPDAGR